MSNTDEIVIRVLAQEERELRRQINEAADNLDYDAIAFDNSRTTLGACRGSSIEGRWLNYLRLLSGLHRGQWDFIFVLNELRRDDPALIKIHKAMP